MCERKDSIEAMAAAADRLAEACEAEIHHFPEIDAAQPARTGVGRALRTAIKELTGTPPDMAVQLNNIRRTGE